MANFPDINPKYDEILLSKKVVREQWDMHELLGVIRDVHK